MVGFITDSLLSAGVAVPLTKPDEDVAVFGDVGFDDDRGLLIASGGTLSPNGISVMRIRDLAGHAANGTFEQVRGSAEEIHLHAASRHGVHRFALPRSGTRVAPGTLVSNRLPILYSSNNGWDHSVKQGEVAEGAFRCTQSYDGHRGEVTAVVAPPYFSEVKGPTGTFATAARDGCVLLWDRGHGAIPLHRFRTTTSPAVAYDSTGMVLAVTGSYDAVQLYDLRMLRRGEAVPFAVVPTGLKPTETPLSLQFCPYASSEAPKEHLLIAGARYELYCIDVGWDRQAEASKRLHKQRQLQQHAQHAVTRKHICSFAERCESHENHGTPHTQRSRRLPPGRCCYLPGERER